MNAEPRVLNHETVSADDASPQHWLYVLHGIYGAGRNWASVIRRVVRKRPEWGAVLIDLREHGGSQGFEPPHTVQAAALDVAALADRTGMTPSAVLGHSFGGKVALLVAALDDRAIERLRQVWVIDSTPEAREPAGSAWSMLELLRSLPQTFPDRDSLVSAMVDRGVQRPVAQWMATNLEASHGAYRWRFDLDAMESLLLSFFASDAWHVVESPPANVEVHLVKADESSVLEGASLRRCEAAAEGRRTHVHRVAGGHWVNAENPGAIEELLVRLLPR